MLRLGPFLLAPLVLVGAASCRSEKPAANPTGQVEKPRVEADLAYITVSKKAFQAIGLQTQPLTLRPVQERLTLTGWIMAKPGHEVIMTAPAPGYVRLNKGVTRAPIAGDRVVMGQELLAIEPVLTPVDQIQLAALKRSVESELAKAKTSLANATKEFERIRELHAKNLRSQQDLDQGQKTLEHAREDLAGAQDKLKLFAMSNIPLRMPRAGVVLALHASPGQYVAAAAPVVTVIDMQPAWLRVPVPEFDLPHIDAQQKIAVTWKNGSGSGPTAGFVAHPVGRVAQVDPLRHTADFWYELEPMKDATFFKDQMLTVYMPLSKSQPSQVAPYGAVVFDTHGSAWIYLDRTKADDKQHRFVRQRVQLGAPIEDGLILRAEISDGERIVTAGAAVLFSREFHKTPAGEDDDD